MHAQMWMFLIPQQISQLQRNEHQSVTLWDPECSLLAYHIHVGTCGIGSMSVQCGYHTRHMLCIRGVLKALLGVVKSSMVRSQLTSSLEVFQILISTEGRIVTVLENSCYGILKREGGRK